VVVSSRAYAYERPDLMMMAITSQLRPTPALGEVWLLHWQSTGLLEPSAVKPVIATSRTEGLVIRTLAPWYPRIRTPCASPSARSSAETHPR
jgi:mRNA interferase MazF